MPLHSLSCAIRPYGEVCLQELIGLKRLQKRMSRTVLTLLAFVTGNISLEPLLEGLFAQIHIDIS